MSLIAPTRPQVRVLVVDDSAFMRTALSRMISSEPGLEVVGTASNGSDALAKIPELAPDVVTLDLEMPGLNGLDTLRHIMTHFPCPVIMVSSVTDREAEITFNALASGAFDYIPKQLSGNSLDIVHLRSDLVAKIRAAANSGPSYVADKLARKNVQSSVGLPATVGAPVPAIVAIGTSTGGPKALQEILPQFPRDLSVPVLIVQHMPAGFTGPFAQRLNSLCAITICEASHRAVLRPGVVYIAPAGTHMKVERLSESRSIICLDPQPEDHLHIPSVDVTMRSVAEAFGSQALGVIMTGMGSDGAEGMKEIHRRGGLTLGQDETSCTVYGMPRACAELNILTRVVPLSQIPAQILQATRYRKRA